MKGNIKFKVILSLCIGLLLMIFIQVMYYKNMKRLSASRELVSHTQLVLEKAKNISSGLSILESESRGYAIAGRKDFLNHFDSISASIEQSLAEIKRLTKDNREQQKRINELSPFVIAKVHFTATVIKVTDSKGKQAALELITRGKGRDLMNTIYLLLDSIQEEENKLLASKNVETDEATSQIYLIGIIGGLVAIIIVIMSSVVLIKDINKRVQIQQELSESESRIKKFLEAVPMGIYVLGADGKPYYANAKSIELLGKGIYDGSLSELSQVYQVYRAGTDQEYPFSEFPIVKALSGISSSASDLEIRASENPILLEVNGQPIKDSEGKIKYAIATFQDITQRRKSELALKEALADAKSSAIAKERFLANMSHEIRTPLNAIIGFANLIDKSKLEPEQADFVESIASAGGNLLSIINDILDFSKIEAGMMLLEKTTFSISSLLHSVQVLLSRKAQDKRLILKLHVDDKIPQYVMGDPTRLTQILINLVGNAIKFTANGHIEVSCNIEREVENKAYIMFCVKDTGIGIPIEKQAVIFERFNQASTETNRSYGGTGLGLSIAKSLVEIQGGQLQLESNPGQGSAFFFTIGYEVASIDEQNILNDQVVEKNVDLGNLKALLVEDNEMNQKLAKKVLTGFGLQVEIAANGKIAVDTLRHNSFHFVLMDMQMPEMDGEEATYIIRNELKSDIPIIAMTAHAMPGEREKCLRMGMNDYISKPFKAQELFAKIAHQMGHVEKVVLSELHAAKVAASTRVTNLSYLNELAEGSKEFKIEMMDIFLNIFPQDLAKLEEAVYTINYKTIMTTAHKMKSSLNIMGISAGVEVIEDLEEKGHGEKEIEKINIVFKELKFIAEKALKEVEEEKLMLS